MHFYSGYNRSHAPSPCFIGFTFQYIPLAASESVQELCCIRSSSGPSLIGQRVTLPYRLNGHILACDALDTACQVNMLLSADEIIRNGTNIWTWCFFVLSIPLFCNPNWSKKNVCKNPNKNVGKARKDPEKAGNVQRVRFIWVYSSLHSLDLWWASLHNPDGWCAVPLPLSCTQRKVSKFQRFLCFSPMPATIMKQ